MTTTEEIINDPGVLSREEKLLRWGEGPWLDEPDRVEFQHRGLPCLITRHPEFGSLCGYVAVPPGHPWHSQYNPPVSVHGSCTYASECADRICHVPKPGEPADVWWFGFDCGHTHDLLPLYQASPFAGIFKNLQYRDYPYVELQVRFLAEQLHALAGHEGGTTKQADT